MTGVELRTGSDTAPTSGSKALISSGAVYTALPTAGSASVATSAWASDTTYSDYPYRAAVAVSAVTATSYVSVTPTDTAVVTGGNLAPWCESYAGGFYLYAKTAPSSAIAITYNYTKTK